MAWRGGVASVVLLAALAIAWRGVAIADAPRPSFNCALAKAPIELLICSDPRLAKADADLAAEYATRLAPLSGASRDALVAEQRAWLKSRFTTCGIPTTSSIPPAGPVKACLAGLYQDRIAALAAQAQQPAQQAAQQPAQQLASPAPAQAAAPIEESLPTVLGFGTGTLPAKGEQQTILSVATFGRYAVTVNSQQGVALQLVDRMTGPGEVSGAAGREDGRIDAFLDRGHYKVLLHADPLGSGDAALTVRPFQELSGPEIPRLPEIKRIDTALDDFQQRSYWLQITDRRVVQIEAAGRNLADMRLWRDGNWLVDAAPAAAEIEPKPGKPLAVRRIVTTLEPGLYLLSTYGGPSETWAKTSDEHPLHLRMGIPSIADAGRAAYTASPFGIDRYLVPANANYFRLELPEAEAASLAVVDYDEQNPYQSGDARPITKQSLPPVTEITNDSGNATEWKVVTVTREAGKPYVLQHFESVRTYYFEGSGDYWIGSLHSGFGEDNVDATGVLTKQAIDYPERIIASNAPVLDRQAAWKRRFNLLEAVTVFFHVTEAGSYVIEESGRAKARYRFEPMIHIGVDYKAPDYQPAGYAWKLDPGYYILSGAPKSDGKGILDITVRAQDAPAPAGAQAKETSVLFPSQHLDTGFHYTLYLNQQPGVEAGVVLRRLPIDLRAGLPVVLKAGQNLDIPVTAPGDGLVTAVNEMAQPMAFAIDHGAPVTAWRGDPGRHVLTLANGTARAFSATLRFTPDSLAPQTPLPAMPPELLAAIPNFPQLIPDQPAYFDIATDEHRTFALDVAQPGLYRVESSGLLQTEGAMRTRTVVSLDHEANNGTGRNFLVQQYLGQGAYQVTVAAQGATHGHMGLAATRTVLMDGGALSPGIPARNTIAAGNGILYTFTIAAPGRYHLQALGLGRSFTMRLEDQDGWPIIAPNAPAELEQDFAAGTYRLVILPQPVDARIVTLLQPVSQPLPLEGHGPHDLALNSSVDFQWLEPEPGAVRVPDQWRLRLTAPAHLSIDLTRGMVAALVDEATGKSRDVVNGGETWKGLLPAGSYLLKATTRAPNNRFDYTISVNAKELLPGESRAIGLPADVPVSIGSDAVAEIGSFGTNDVRAWLYDAQGKLVATNDDRPNDWNFAIAGRMRPGFYRLHVEAVGVATSGAPAPAGNTVEDGENDQTSGQGDGSDNSAAAQTPDASAGGTTVSIYQAEEQSEPALAVGADTRFSGPKVHVVPLALPSGTATNGVIVVSADGNGPAVGLSLEAKDGAGWRTLGESTARAPWLALPLAGGGDYRLRIWSVDRSTASILLQTRMVAPSPATMAAFTGSGMTLQAVPGIQPPLGLAAVAVNAAGAFTLSQPLPADVAWSTEPGRALAGDPAGLVFGDKGTFWFGARLISTAGSVAATPLVPGDTASALTVPGAEHGATVIADPVAGNSAPRLWLVESRLGQPSIGAAGLIGAVAPGSAVAITPGVKQQGFALRLWNAGDPATPLPVTLRRVDFAFMPPGRDALDWGINDRKLAARGALSFALPTGLKRITLALPPETAVVLGNAKTDAVWSGDASLALTLDSGSERLLVLSAAGSEQQIGVALAPLAAGDALASLAGGSIFPQYFAATGVVRIDIRRSAAERKRAATLRLNLGGAVTGATLLRDDGTVSREGDAGLDGDGEVEIAHGPGLVVAWLDGGDPLTSLGVAAKATIVRSTAVLPLSAAAQQLVFAVERPTFLHLKTTAPVLAQLKPAGDSQRLQVFADGADLNLLLPKGTTPLVLRAADDGALSGVAEALLTPVSPIGEGLGPKARLAPGESRLYSFTVKDERDIGVGVRGSTDSAHCRVLDAAGATVGGGVVEMLHLKAGTYLLAVDAPSDGNAIEVQPALVGVAAPDGSPPEDVRRSYLELAGLKPKQQE